MFVDSPGVYMYIHNIFILIQFFVKSLIPPPTPSGVPQPFLPRSLPLQQHSIMGQPYIELRHRTPENRLRLSFSLPEAPSLPFPRDPQLFGVRPGPGTRMGETMVMDHLNQKHLVHAGGLTQSGEAVLHEEHLEDSAVKDLEDVEVKDLVDLNLNLDPEDGKSLTCGSSEPGWS